MSCPHSSAIGSTPATCSLCLQSTMRVDVKQVVISKQGGVVSIDGEVIGTIAEINKAKQREETQYSGPQKKRTCGICSSPGHNRATCNNEVAINDKRLAESLDVN